jgi:hypothetical protein
MRGMGTHPTRGSACGKPNDPLCPWLSATCPSALDRLGDTAPNTSAIERRNGTSRRMNAYQVRKSLAFSRRPETKFALGFDLGRIHAANCTTVVSTSSQAVRIVSYNVENKFPGKKGQSVFSWRNAV